jgi:hypothetical protein
MKSVEPWLKLAQVVGELTALFTEKRAVEHGSHDRRGEHLELEDSRLVD